MRTADTRLRCSIVRFDERSPRWVNPEQPATSVNPPRLTWNGSRSQSEVAEGRQMKNLMARFIREEGGQDLIEYSLLAALISVACIAVMTLVANEIIAVFNLIIAAMPG